MPTTLDLEVGQSVYLQDLTSNMVVAFNILAEEYKKRISWECSHLRISRWVVPHHFVWNRLRMWRRSARPTWFPRGIKSAAWQWENHRKSRCTFWCRFFFRGIALCMLCFGGLYIYIDIFAHYTSTLLWITNELAIQLYNCNANWERLRSQNSGSFEE